MDLLDLLERPTVAQTAATSRCEWIGHAVPPVREGAAVTPCTASYVWTVKTLFDDGMAVLAPSPRDRWRTPVTVHTQHLEVVAG